MTTLPIHAHLPNASRLIYGCMGLGGSWEESHLSLCGADPKIARAAISAAVTAGITVFDHADIYKNGKAEAVFGEVLRARPSLRDKIILQSKCGIRFEDTWGPHRFDFSPEWITQSVEGSLRRLETDYLDVFMLHRPDPLMEPELIAEAFERLHAAGKVKYFAVSNMHHHQVSYLQSFLSRPLIANQLEMSLTALNWVNEGIDHNTPNGAYAPFTPGTLEYCRRARVQLQAWSPLSGGLFTGKKLTSAPSHIRETAELISALAALNSVSREAIVLAWLLRHPAGIQPVIGTTHPGRIAACAEASEISLTREDWYRIYNAARGVSLP